MQTRDEAVGPGRWSPDELDRVEEARELEIAVRRADGTLRRWVPIWWVRVGTRVYVRSWYRRDTGWFGAAVRTGRARVRIRDMEADVVVEDVGEGGVEVRDGVDAAYRAKYGSSGDGSVAGMVGASPAATTLRLLPAEQATPGTLGP